MEKRTNQNPTDQITSKDVLRLILLKKIKANAAYSARAFARDLGVSPAFITMVLNGKKKINLNRAVEIAQALKLAESDKQALIGSVLQENGLALEFKHKVDLEKIVSLSEEQFSVVADWYHFAILDLATTVDFQSSPQWIAKRLGLKAFEVEAAIHRLIKVGLMTKTGGVLKKSKSNIDLPTTRSTTAVREHHKQMMARASEQLEKTDQKSFQKRMICSVTFAASAKRIEQGRKKVLEFQQELADFMSGGDECDEVFQLNIQFFPHTRDSE